MHRWCTGGGGGSGVELDGAKLWRKRVEKGWFTFTLVERVVFLTFMVDRLLLLFLLRLRFQVLLCS